MAEEREIIGIEEAGEGLKIIMRGANVTMAWLHPDGSVTFTNKKGTFKVTRQQIQTADRFAETGVWPARGAIDPELISKPESRRRKRR